MNKININDINFQKLMLLNTHGSTSSIYTDSNICYKLLNKLYDFEKIETLENLKKWFFMLINKNVKIIDLPYLDEIINLQDDYIIDKKII